MQGTLDNPPIIIEQDKAKISSLLVLSMSLFIITGLLTWSGVGKSVAWGYFVVTIFGIMTLAQVVQLVRPGRLIVDRDGLTCRLLLNTVRYSWEDIATFDTYAPSSLFPRPAFTLAESSKRHPISRRLTGGLGTLGTAWEFSAAEIVDMLNEARKRWGKQSP